MSCCDHRLRAELRNLERDPPDGFSLGPREDGCLTEWAAVLWGFPPDSVYAGGRFELALSFPDRYPYVAPSVKFRTKVWHSNVSPRTGQICLDILKGEWSPALTARKLVVSIMSLMTSPNPDDPLAPDIAFLYKSNRPLHDRRARNWTRMYASD